MVPSPRGHLIVSVRTDQTTAVFVSVCTVPLWIFRIYSLSWLRTSWRTRVHLTWMSFVCSVCLFFSEVSEQNHLRMQFLTRLLWLHLSWIWYYSAPQTLSSSDRPLLLSTAFTFVSVLTYLRLLMTKCDLFLGDSPASEPKIRAVKSKWLFKYSPPSLLLIHL